MVSRRPSLFMERFQIGVRLVKKYTNPGGHCRSFFFKKDPLINVISRTFDFQLLIFFFGSYN